MEMQSTLKNRCPEKVSKNKEEPIFRNENIMMTGILKGLIYFFRSEMTLTTLFSRYSKDEVRFHERCIESRGRHIKGFFPLSFFIVTYMMTDSFPHSFCVLPIGYTKIPF